MGLWRTAFYRFRHASALSLPRRRIILTLDYRSAEAPAEEQFLSLGLTNDEALRLAKSLQTAAQESERRTIGADAPEEELEVRSYH